MMIRLLEALPILAAAVAAVLAALGGLLFRARKAGETAQRERQARVDAEAKRKVDEAVASQPSDAEELIRRLREGGRL